MNIIPGVPPRIMFHNPAENLTGVVQNKKASDLEERSARSIAKLNDWGFVFRVRINPITHYLTERFSNLKGELELDFICQKGNRLVPVLVQGEISHYYAAWMREVDKRKQAEITDALKPYNAEKLIVVPYYEITNQAMSDRYYREVLR